jgi:hypothetical protein
MVFDKLSSIWSGRKFDDNNAAGQEAGSDEAAAAEEDADAAGNISETGSSLRDARIDSSNSEGAGIPSRFRREDDLEGRVFTSFREMENPPRLVLRNLPFHQSRNRIAVKHNVPAGKMVWLLRHDWFHVLVRFPTHYSLALLLAIWTSMVLAFAGFYVAVDRHDPNQNCGLGAPPNPIHFGGAFAFSLETCTTVGYGLPNSTNAYFENCPGLQVVIYFQMVWSMMFNAFLFAFFYSRMAKCDARGAQVVMSCRALVSYVSGQVRFQVRCYDVDARNPVVEAHVRLYAVTKSRPVPRPLRMLQPNDDFGAMLLLSVPTVVSHHVDEYSVLHPGVTAARGTGAVMPPPSGLNLRQVDGVVCNRDVFMCPICGETYGTIDRWIRHARYQRIVEEHDDYPVAGTHRSLTEDELTLPQEKDPADQVAAMKEYFQSELSEVICVVEGIEPVGSGTFSALQSYRFEDIVFDAQARFQPCIEATPQGIRVDLYRFHGMDLEGGDESEHDQCLRPTTRTHHSVRKHDSFFTDGEQLRTTKSRHSTGTSHHRPPTNSSHDTTSHQYNCR